MGKFSASFVRIFGQFWVSFQPNLSELLGELLSKLWQVFGDLLASVVGHLEPFRRKFYPVFVDLLASFVGTLDQLCAAYSGKFRALFASYGGLLASFVGHFEGTSEQFWRKF